MPPPVRARTIGSLLEILGVDLQFILLIGAQTERRNDLG
jgi:hypothetical protein